MKLPEIQPHTLEKIVRRDIHMNEIISHHILTRLYVFYKKERKKFNKISKCFLFHCILKLKFLNAPPYSYRATRENAFLIQSMFKKKTF